MAAALLFAPATASAWTLGDLLGGLTGSGDTGSTIGNLIEGVFSSSNISVADMAGEWTVDGSAVSFQSENFLKKAGGAAAASAIEAKLDPYYKQYGLTGGVFTIQTDGSFKLKLKKMTLNGTIEETKQKGVFNFTFTALGGIRIGIMTTYVQKTSNSMDIMFDATKLESLLSIAAQFTGSKLATTAVNILKSYEGICVGFGCTKTGKVEGESDNSFGDIINGLFGIGQQNNSGNTGKGSTTNTGKSTGKNTNTGKSTGKSTNTGKNTGKSTNTGKNNNQKGQNNNTDEDPNAGMEGITNLLNGLFGGRK